MAVISLLYTAGFLKNKISFLRLVFINSCEEDQENAFSSINKHLDKLLKAVNKPEYL